MTLFVLLTVLSFAGNDITINKNGAKVFSTLPDGVAFPESITANPKSGEIYVSPFNKKGNLWLAANQADQIMVLNGFGQMVAKLGELLKIQKSDSLRGLPLPESLVIQGKWVFVPNLALPLTTIGGDDPEENIMKYTISRIKIPANID